MGRCFDTCCNNRMHPLFARIVCYNHCFLHAIKSFCSLWQHFLSWDDDLDNITQRNGRIHEFVLLNISDRLISYHKTLSEANLPSLSTKEIKLLRTMLKQDVNGLISKELNFDVNVITINKQINWEVVWTIIWTIAIFSYKMAYNTIFSRGTW